MRNPIRWLEDLLYPKELQSLDFGELAIALNDINCRSEWFLQIYEDLKRMNIEVDLILRNGDTDRLNDLCVRRKAYQDVLEAILASKRNVTRSVRPNPQPKPVTTDLDRVTAY